MLLRLHCNLYIASNYLVAVSIEQEYVKADTPASKPNYLPPFFRHCILLVEPGSGGIKLPVGLKFISSLLLSSSSSLPTLPPLLDPLLSSLFFVVIMAASALLKSRVRRPSYLNKLCKAEDLIDLFPHGSYIGWSGFTGVGYPKYVVIYSVLDEGHG